MRSSLLLLLCLTLAAPLSATSIVRTQLEEKAANGEVEAMQALTVFCMAGIEGPVDEARAKELQKAIAANTSSENKTLISHSQYRTSLMLYFDEPDIMGDMPESNRLMFEAAHNGDLGAIQDIGNCYYHGICGFAQDYKKAFECFQQSALWDRSSPTLKLGLCYLNGQGTQRNESMARKYFDISLSKEHIAMHRPEMHIQLMDEAQAHGSTDTFFADLVKKADANDKHAMAKLGFAYWQGHHLPVNWQKAFVYFLRAGDAQSLLFAHDIASRKHDKSIARSLLKQAAALDNPKAVWRLVCAQLQDKDPSLNLSIASAELTKSLLNLARKRAALCTPLFPKSPSLQLARLYLGHHNTTEQEHPVNKITAIEYLLSSYIDTYAAPYLAQLLEEYKAETPTP